MATEIQRKPEKIFQSKAHEVLYFSAYPQGIKAAAPVKELMDVWGCGLSTAYDKIDNGNFSIDEFTAAARLFGSRGDFQLSNLSVPEGWGITSHKCTCVNGSLDDESKDLIQAVGEVIRDFDKGNKVGALRKLPHVKDVVSRIEREVIA